jgi:hypothetical protein
MGYLGISEYGGGGTDMESPTISILGCVVSELLILLLRRPAHPKMTLTEN